MFRTASFMLALALVVISIVGVQVLMRTVQGGHRPRSEAYARRKPVGAKPTSAATHLIGPTVVIKPIIAATPESTPTSAPVHGVPRVAVVVPAPSVPVASVAPAQPPTSALRVVAGPATISLPNYWVNARAVNAGRTASIVYQIVNNTGGPVRLLLGASIKLHGSGSWATTAISDPVHDVAASVLPGATMHLRYFTVPANLPSGSYDVAWGLRDASSGRFVALSTAQAVLQVRRAN